MSEAKPLVDHVDAIFGGKPVRFRIGPRGLAWFETLHGSGMACLRRFTSGSWTVADLRAVLGAGHPNKLRSGPTIDAVLAANRPGSYSGLGTMVLVAALSGIPPDAAKFDEAA